MRCWSSITEASRLPLFIQGRSRQRKTGTCNQPESSSYRDVEKKSSGLFHRPPIRSRSVSALQGEVPHTM